MEGKTVNGNKKILTICAIITVSFLIVGTFVGYGQMKNTVDSNKVAVNVLQVKVNENEKAIAEMKVTINQTYELTKVLVEKQLGITEVTNAMTRAKRDTQNDSISSGDN